jgi:hypothetical protein
MDDDKIIARAMIEIRKGIVDGVWQSVCNAYESITGEWIDPPEDKEPEPELSRLEKIKLEMQNLAEEDDPDNGEPLDTVSVGRVDYEWENLTVAKIKEGLVNIHGVDPKEFKGKKKQALIDLAHNLEEAYVELSSLSEDDPDEFDGIPDVGVIRSKKNIYGGGKLQVFSTPEDEEEREANKKMAKKKPKLPVKRSGPPKDNSDNKNASVRYHSNPTNKPERD